MGAHFRSGLIAIGMIIGCLLTQAVAAITPRFQTDRITVEEWTAYLAEAKALPGVSVRESAMQLTVTQEKPTVTIYAFTTTGNPAHPAVIVREIAQRADGIYIDRKGHYAGSVDEFKRWWSAFDQLDAKIKADLKSQPKTQPPQPTGDTTPNPRQSEAEALAVKWLDLIQAGDYRESYALMNAVFKQNLTLEVWRKQIDERRARLGKLQSRKIRRIVWYKDPPTAALPGTYAAVEFDSVFETTDAHFQYLILHSQTGEPFKVMRSDETSVRKGSSAASGDAR